MTSLVVARLCEFCLYLYGFKISTLTYTKTVQEGYFLYRFTIIILQIKLAKDSHLGHIHAEMLPLANQELAYHLLYQSCVVFED